jgi:hypothetical protein
VHRVGGTAPGAIALNATIARQGPVAVGLHFEGTVTPEGSSALPIAVDLTFPRSKSWVEATLSLDDPAGTIAALGVDLRLKLEGQPRLFEFGANSTVYGEFRAGEQAAMSADIAMGLDDSRVPWAIRKGKGKALSPIAEAAKPDATPAEGWAHVMDRTRASAVAVAGFGHAARDTIGIDAEGNVNLLREFSGKKNNDPRQS